MFSNFLRGGTIRCKIIFVNCKVVNWMCMNKTLNLVDNEQLNNNISANQLL